MRYSILILLSLMACAPNAPSHLPNPLTLPFSAIGNGISNTIYDTRRNKVSLYVRTHFVAIKREVPTDSHPQLSEAMALAKISNANQAALLSELRKNPDIYLTDDPEPLIVALMVHGN